MMKKTMILGLLALASVVLVPGTGAAPDDDPCKGIWYNEYDAGPVTVGTNLNPGCTFVDVYLPPTEVCVTEGDWYKVRTYGPVTVWQYRCGSP